MLVDIIVSVSATLSVYFLLFFFMGRPALFSIYGFITLSAFIASAGIFLIYGTYRGIMRHAAMQEIWRIFLAIICKSVLLFFLFSLFFDYYGAGLSVEKIAIAQVCDIICSLALLVGLRVFLIYFYELFMSASNNRSHRVLIYGDDMQSLSLSAYLSKNLHSEFRVVGYVKMQDHRSMLKLEGLTVYTIDSYEYFQKVIDKKDVNAIVFPSQSSALAEKNTLVTFCIDRCIKVLLLPQLSEVTDAGSVTPRIREIKIEDLLGRDEIRINMPEIREMLSGKTVMVTGGAGSIGSGLCRLISTFAIKKLVIVDNAETPLYNIQMEITDREHKNFFEKNPGMLDVFGRETEAGKRLFTAYMADRYGFEIADVRTGVRIDCLFAHYRPHILFHAAAYKHVQLMENTPCEAVGVNVFGTQIVADACLKHGVEKMLLVSTDKAVNPTNVMGCSKRLAEIYVQTLSKAVILGEVPGKTKFITTRFGNVLGPDGSVIPRFREQIMSGGPVTVAHKDIIRFFMTIPEACRLMLEAATMGEGYEIFVFDMGRPVRIADMARDMISLAGFVPGIDIKIEYTGLRPGEKLYEELLNDKESTIPTGNRKISVAKVRSYQYEVVREQFARLKSLTKELDKIGTVSMMKVIVPEFKSRNPVYCTLDEKS